MSLPIRPKDLSTLGMDLLIFRSGSAAHFELHCLVFSNELEPIKEAFAGLSGITIHTGSFEYSYPKFCLSLREHGLHFLIHVSSDALQELYPYKTYNYLITASFCNAVPVILNRPPYDRLKKECAELAPLIPDTREDVMKVIESVVLRPELARNYLDACKTFIDRSYPIQRNIDFLNKLLRESDGPYFMNTSINHGIVVLDPSFYRTIYTRPQFYASVKGCFAFAYKRVTRALKKAFVSDVAKLFRKLRAPPSGAKRTRAAL